jgi:hypothetical protein
MRSIQPARRAPVLLTSLLFAFFTPAALAAEDGCGSYAPEVLARAYNSSSDCLLHEAGEKPLWHGLPPPGIRQQIRFTFSAIMTSISTARRWTWSASPPRAIASRR